MVCQLQNIVIGLSHIPTVFVYIRSPYTGWDDYAWQVDPSGDIPYGDYVDVYYSYGHFNSIDYYEYIQKYWWLRSPITNYNYGTWFVRSSGAVDYNFGNSIGDSYG